MATLVKALMALALLCCAGCSRISYWVFENNTATRIEVVCDGASFSLEPKQVLEVRALKCVFKSDGRVWTYDWREVPREFIETKFDGARIYWRIDAAKSLQLKMPQRDGPPILPATQPAGFPLVPTET